MITAIDLSNLSIADIKQMLEKKTTKLRSLKSRRERLQSQIQTLDLQISEMTGNDANPDRIVRVKNEKTLSPCVTEVLQKNKKGLTLEQLATSVQEMGYVSKSINFKNVLYQCLHAREDIKSEKNGIQFIYSLRE